ncbi:MAG: hypothetical protein AB7S77_01510 [Desulfatirhabdiaceae bacterium]
MFRYLYFILLTLSLGAPAVSGAGDFDGSKPLLISILRVNECTPDGSCRQISVEEANISQFFKIDFASKKISRVGDNSGIPASTIKQMERIDGKLFLQGAEDGYEDLRDGVGWTIAISEDTGRVVLTASAENLAYVVFGACIPANP